MHYFKYIIFFVGIGLATSLTKLYANNPTLDSAYFFDKTQDFEKAERFFKLYLSENKKMDSLSIEVMLRIARAERILFKNALSLNTYLKAIEWSKRINNAELLFKTRVQLADFYTLTQRIDDADELFNDLTPLPEFSPVTLCIYLNRKAAYLNHIGKLDEAIKHSNEALILAKKNNYTNEQATIYNELGNIYEQKKEYNKALTYFDKALELNRNDQINHANTYLNKAKLYFNQKNYRLAIHHLENNLKNIANTNWSNLKCPILQYNSTAYFALNDSINGYKYLAEYQKEANNYYLNNQNKTIAELETKFKTEQKNAEIIKQSELVKAKTQVQKTKHASTIPTKMAEPAQMDKYTIQLAVTANKKALDKIAQKTHITKQSQVFRMKIGKKEEYVLTYGHYKTKSAAEYALHSLPKAVQKLKPYVQPISKYTSAQKISA